MDNSDSDNIPEFDLKMNSRVEQKGDRTSNSTGKSNNESDTESMEIAQVETVRSSHTRKRQLQLLVDAVANFF